MPLAHEKESSRVKQGSDSTEQNAQHLHPNTERKHLDCFREGLG